MPISFVCPNGHPFQVRDELSGKKVRCPQCSAVTLVGPGAAGPGQTGAARKPPGTAKPGADSSDLNDPFEDEDAPSARRPAASRSTSRTAVSKPSGGRKKRSSKSQGSGPPLGLLLGVFAGFALLGTGVWLWLGRGSGKPASGPVAVAPSVPPASTAPASGMPTAAASTAVTGNSGPALAPTTSELSKEVAALPFPPMTDPAYGPPPPSGLVLSRSIVNALTEMLTTLMRADGSPGPLPHQMVTNVVTNVAKFRTEEPQMFCLPAEVEAALLAGKADLPAIRRDFDAALAAMEPAGAQLPAMVMTQLPAYRQNALDPARILFMTSLLRSKLKKVQAAGPKPTAASPPTMSPPPPSPPPAPSGQPGP